MPIIIREPEIKPVKKAKRKPAEKLKPSPKPKPTKCPRSEACTAQKNIYVEQVTHKQLLKDSLITIRGLLAGVNITGSHIEKTVKQLEAAQ
jgi:hypothetical protein